MVQWSDAAIIISSRKYGEGALIVKLLSRNHGIYSGLVRGLKKNTAICQTGNEVEATWKARLEEQLGNFSLELVKPTSPDVFFSSIKLSALASACEVVSLCFMERDPHTKIHDTLKLFIEKLSSDKNWQEYYVKLELELLRLIGFGLDLNSCAATGGFENLVYVSPKSGRAVSLEAGEAYKSKLLRLPSFLSHSTEAKNSEKEVSVREIIDGTRLTGYFLDKYVFAAHNKQLSCARARFTQKILEGCS